MKKNWKEKRENNYEAKDVKRSCPFCGLDEIKRMVIRAVCKEVASN